jgi:hypothetical protein
MNIVKLNDFDRSRRGSPTIDCKQLLRDCRRMASESLARALTSMMNGVDDALFKLAEKAENNAVQSNYFDAMREVRIKRGTMESECNAEFIRGFNRELSPDTSVKSQTLQSLGDELELDLVAHEDLEESLAVKNMIVKIQVNFKQELGALDRRMGFLLSDPELEHINNPLGPEVFCNALRIACEQIESGIKVKLIIMKLFDRYVVGEHIGKIYHEINRYLVSKNVLPKIRHSVPGRPVAGHSGTSAVSPQADDGEDVFATIQELMGVGGSSGGGAGGAWYGGVVGAVPAATLIGNLTRIQHCDPEFMTGGPGDFDMSAVAAGHVNVIRDIRASGMMSGLGQADGMVIDVVAMLFDYILDDNNIPGAMKALIGRLQIPLLKVAMVDRTFFSRKTHPARMLLNRLAHAATGWTSAKDDGLYKQVERTVQRVLVEFEKDVTIFEELDRELDQFLNAEEHEAEQQAEQSLRLAQGKERLTLAKKRANAEVSKRIADSAIPKEVRLFLRNYWQNLLLVTVVKEGEDSINWKRALTTMDNLVWSVKPKYGTAEADRLVKMLPGLLDLLKEGMELVSMSEAQSQAFLGSLSEVHAQVVHSAPQTGGDLQEPQAIEDPLSRSVDEVNPYPRSIRNPDPLADDFAEPASDMVDDIESADLEEEQEIMTATIHRLVEDGDLEVEEVPEFSEEDVPTLDEAVDDQHVDQARLLEVGTWIELSQDTGEPVRAKLTWISPVTGVYLFTDRQGLRAADMTLQVLAGNLRNGTARIIDNAPLFERAVGSVIDDLKKQAS